MTTPTPHHEAHQVQRDTLRHPTPSARHESAMLRYLGAVHYVSRSVEQQQETAPSSPRRLPPAADTAELRVALAAVDDAAERPVSEVMTPAPVVSVRVGAPFGDIARVLVREQVNAVPVVDSDDRVVGVVSESNLLARAASLAAPSLSPVEWVRGHGTRARGQAVLACDLMTSPAITVRAGESIGHTAWLAARHRIKLLPVVDDEARLVGVVTRSDLVRAFLPAEGASAPRRTARASR